VSTKLVEFVGRNALDGRVVIVGAGQAGAQTAVLLRQYGWTGPIDLIGEESIAPYQRPPLSKAWLKGEADADSLALRPSDFYDNNGIGLSLGAVVNSIDAASKRVQFADGRYEPYDVLVVATGARPRRLGVIGETMPRVLSLRSADDAETLKLALGAGKIVAIIGGGYVGLEVAASARALGAEAIVIEREECLLARVASSHLAAFFLRHHQLRGVEFRLANHAVRFEGDERGVQAVHLADGERLTCDLVVVGVGALANLELARDAGLTCTNGIVVDLAGRTSDPDIYAVGDVTCRPSPLYDRMLRLESVPNALEQAKQVASKLCGREPPRLEVPWFWSDQYDLKLQIAGLPFGVANIVMRGQADSNQFAVFHLDADDRVQAVEAINAPSEFMGGRKLIELRLPVDREKLADASLPMKAFLAA
jgi:3-phenylpropionate/trans-cinnamate dioxygenase ferredoxin reductase subunit